MQYTKIDRFMDGVDEFVRGVRGWTKRDHTQFWPIVCAHNANVLALHNGSLLSVIKINGYLGQYFKSDFVNLRKEWERFFQINAKDKTSAGFDLFWSYEYDPDELRTQGVVMELGGVVVVDAFRIGRRHLVVGEKPLSADLQNIVWIPHQPFVARTLVWLRHSRQGFLILLGTITIGEGKPGKMFKLIAPAHMVRFALRQPPAELLLDYSLGVPKAGFG